MKYTLYAFLALIAVAAYKAAKNYISLRRIRQYRLERDKFLEIDAGSGPGWDFPKKVPIIKDLVLKSGVGDQQVSWMEPIGYGQIQQQTMSILDNLAFRNRTVQIRATDLLYRAEGVFENRLREAISPFYWVDTITHIPSITLKYIGISEASSVPKIANLIIWIVTVLGFIFSLPDFEGLKISVSKFLSSISDIL